MPIIINGAVSKNVRRWNVRKAHGKYNFLFSTAPEPDLQVDPVKLSSGVSPGQVSILKGNTQSSGMQIWRIWRMWQRWQER